MGLEPEDLRRSVVAHRQVKNAPTGLRRCLPICKGEIPDPDAAIALPVLPKRAEQVPLSLVSHDARILDGDPRVFGFRQLRCLNRQQRLSNFPFERRRGFLRDR